MSRRDDLEQLIRDQERLILEHEQIIQTTDRPEERLNSQRKLQEHRASLERYRAELAALPAEARQARPAGPLPAPPPPPRHAGRLVGRQKELDRLCRRLRGEEGTPAWVAVRGIGGVGKSELAIAAAHALYDYFEGRVIWLEGGVHSVEAIQDRLAAALGIELPSPGDPQRDDTLTWVLSRQKPTLIVLDDLRRAHLDRWRALCPPSPPCAALITSRRTDLPLPPRAVIPLDELHDADAVELLAFLLPEGWADAEPQAVAEIAALLDGIPLALTLAARRAARLTRVAHPLTTLCDELRTHRERVLNQTDRPERRDMSVFLTFDLSFDDLDAPDRDRLRRLGVFARNEIELPALAAVWETDEEQARAAANRLADAGLIEESESDKWWMHDLLRAHAADRLRAVPEQHLAARLAHAAHWQRWLDDFVPRSPGDWQQLNAQRPELEAAVEWLLKEQPHNLITVRLALAMIQNFPASTFSRGVDWLRAALSVAQDRQRAAEQDAERPMWDNMAAQVQSSLAILLSARGQYDEAEQLYRASLPLLARSGDIKNLATTQARLADLLFQIRAQYDEAEWLYRSSLDIMEKLDDTANAAMMQSKLADLLFHVRAQYDEAEQRYRSSLHLFETMQDSRSAAVTRSNLADLLCRREQYHEAERLYRQSIHTFETIAQPRSLATTQTKLANLLRIHGRYDDAEQLYRAALEVMEELGDRRSGANVQLSLADLACARQEYDQAEHLYRLSLEASSTLGDRRSAAITRGKLATCLRRCGKLDEAEAEYRSSLHELEELKLCREAAVTQLNLAGLLDARGQYDEAERLYRQSMSTFKELQDVNSMIAQLRLADMLFNHKRYEEAEALYADGLKFAQQHQDAQYVAAFMNRLAQIRNKPRPTDAGV